MLVREPLRQGRPDLRCDGAFWTALAALLLGGLFLAPAAQAAYQQVGNFAGVPGLLKKHESEFPEEVQLGGLGGMAVNYTGAGGVPAGTIYAATGSSQANETRVARYKPDRSFSERWEVVPQEVEEAREAKGEEPYERCGPEGAAAHPSCKPKVGTNESTVDVEVDQTTGNVYVFSFFEGIGRPQIAVYNADGTEAITRFGIRAAAGEHVPESPAKIHGTSATQAIAVNAAGEVYVFDLDSFDNFYHRLMLFKPKSPGDYTEYEYAGQSHDIGAGFGSETNYPARPVVDAVGNVYVSVYDHVEKYDPAHPGDPPVCDFFFKKGQILSMTVNPLTGEAFFRAGGADKKIHRLNPCVEGKFSEAEAIEVTPTRILIAGMAVDPVAHFEASGPAGILYVGSPSPEGGETNSEGATESAIGYVLAPPNEVPPTVVSESVSAVTQSSARLEGVVNPKGTPTAYTFQYISDAAFQANLPSDRFAGAGEAPPGGARVEGSKDVSAAATVSGLQAGAEYHMRLVATSHCSPGNPEKECTAEGAGRTFSTYPFEALGPPDLRAYELVSPAQKNGGQVLPANPTVSSCPLVECKPGSAYNFFPLQSAADGDSIVYEGEPFSFDEGALIENEYISRRTDSGWQAANLTPPRLGSKGGGGYQAFTADLGEAVLEQEGGEGLDLTPDSPAGFANLYTQPSTEPLSLSPFLTEAPPNRVPGHTNNNQLRLSYAGASADFSRLFFAANDALTPEAEGGPEAKTNLYESSGGQLRLLNFAPGDASTLPGAVFGSGQLLGLGNPNGPDKFVFHAISKDGSRAFWTSEEDGHLYVREGGQTLEVPDPGSCAASLEVRKRTCFLSAAADGSKVLLSDGLLFDVEDLAAPPVDLTQGQGGFGGLVGQGEDLSRAYFVDTAVLTSEEENEYGDKAQVGKSNLYAWHEGATSFIATLFDKDSDLVLAPTHRAAAASPDGRWLAFVSKGRLTQFDNTGPCEFVASSESFLPAPCPEVFLYQAETGKLRCPSCNRAGTPPHGPSGLLQLRHGSIATLPPPRYLTDSGRLFFDSQDSLSPADTNGRVEDVYEFEPGGVGDCASQAGCVRLISAGDSGFDSNFFTMDPSGRNAFFTSRDRLVKADEDELVDLYDAREGGGFAREAPSGECQGEACLPSVPPSNYQTPASLGFKGIGSFTGKGSGRRCPKGRHKVRHKGKQHCVRRHVKKRQGRHRDHGGAK